MGNATYDFHARDMRAQDMGYTTRPIQQIFKQSRTHESMDPRSITVRECRDSEKHPNAYPLFLALDETGSMGRIPHNLIKYGLPQLMHGLLMRNLPDIAVMFGAIGDHLSDTSYLQVGQFESGDAELDMWLERTYLEGEGGGNGGESYPLAWLFAHARIQSDAWDKRKQKGLIITVGDETYHKDNYTRDKVDYFIPGHGLEQITAQTMLEAAQSRFHVYHIHVDHIMSADRTIGAWRELIGNNLRICSEDKVAQTIIAIAAEAHALENAWTEEKGPVSEDRKSPDQDIIL